MKINSGNWKQDFAFRDSFIHYIGKNPKSVKIYQKLVRSCKYIFIMNPILILSELRNFKCGSMVKAEIGSKCLDVNNISSKCWITEKFYGCIGTKHLGSSLIPKFYKCDAKEVSLFNEIINSKELLFLTQKAKNIYFSGVVVKDVYGSFLPLEKVVEVLPKAKRIGYDFYPQSSSITGKTFKELMKIPHFMTLDAFLLWSVPEEFDLECFSIYMKKNERTEVDLDFDLPLSDGYKIRLNSLVDEIIATPNHDYKPPWIEFDEMDREKYNQLRYILYGPYDL